MSAIDSVAYPIHCSRMMPLFLCPLGGIKTKQIKPQLQLERLDIITASTFFCAISLHLVVKVELVAVVSIFLGCDGGIASFV